MYNYCFLPRTTTVDVHFAKYHYRRAPKDLVATSSSPNVNVYFHDRRLVPLRLPCTSTPRPDRQVSQEHLYLYRHRGSDKYPYNKCTSTVVFGIAKNVKYPFEMTRSASSNDPKYLSENERVPLLPRRS